jgi:CubicO group peptidase (beta-lactamase class C family)
MLRLLSVGLLSAVVFSSAFWPELAIADTGSELPEFEISRQVATQLPDLRSVLISRKGSLVYEQYYAGASSSQAVNMKSASKSIISALTGIAIDKGYITGLDQRIGDFFPELNGSKSEISIEDLLTMQSGLESTSSSNYGRWILSKNWVEFTLQQPLRAEPGTQMIYSTGSTHLLSAIISKASGMSTKEFAQRFLATPMDFRLAYWTQDPQGIFFGGNDMEITPRQMLAFGQLYLNNGLHKDQRILSSDWVQQSHQPHAASPRRHGQFYGYGWWIREMAGLKVPLAWGYGGQLIVIVKELDMVMVLTSDSTPRASRRDHLARLYDLLEAQISHSLGYGR